MNFMVGIVFEFFVARRVFACNVSTSMMIDGMVGQQAFGRKPFITESTIMSVFIIIVLYTQVHRQCRIFFGVKVATIIGANKYR